MAKILIVDDHQGYRRYPAMVLEREGYRVETAAGGREAIEIGTRFEPDVLVVDWLLDNEWNGARVATALREFNPSLQVVVITGFDPMRLEGRDEIDIYRVLSKPFDLDEFLAAVAGALAAA